jgi:hypothetical protein
VSGFELLTPDHTQATWEIGAALFGLLNIRAIRKSRSVTGVHWLPTAYFSAWGVYNLWFYAALDLPMSWWAGIGMCAVNLTWLCHLCYYSLRKGKIQ